MKHLPFYAFFILSLMLLPVIAAAQPVNDAIGDAIELPPTFPSVVTGDTTDATLDTGDAGTDFCGTPITAGGVWYWLNGTGGQMVATTCSALTTYDSKISVFSGTPGDLTCVGGNDDDFSCADGIFDSTFPWDSSADESYYILVHGFGSQQGPFELSVLGAEGDVARFNVTKTFSDFETDEVDVTLSCNTGLPLEQTATIAGGDPAGVTFVVTEIGEGGADCTVTESGGPDGYTPILTGGDECSWEGITNGYYTCQIFNVAEAATFTVYKEWEIFNEGSDAVFGEAYVTIYCDREILNNGMSPKLTANGNGNGFNDSISDYLGDGDSLIAIVDTIQGPATCWAGESIQESGVEPSDDCDPRSIPAGGSSSCTFVNTVFFEGIPTLSQYGLALLALLTLSVGMIGFRRFA